VRKARLKVFGKIFILFFFVIRLGGQDIHFSQFYNSPLNLSPALTGIFNGDQRLQGSFKDQWRTVPVPWMNFAASYDQKLHPKRSDKHFFAAGAQFNYDRQGLSRLNLSNLNLYGSVTYALNKNNLLTGGLAIGYATRGFSQSALSWDRQWTGDFLDPSLPSGENFEAERIHFLETALGLNYRWQKSSRTHVNVGAGLFHFIEPGVAFYNADDITLPKRFTLYGLTNFKLTDALDIQVHGFTQFQSDYRETVLGGLLKVYINQKKGKELQLHIGSGYRTTQSLAPTIAIQYMSIYASFSYDLDLSDFQDFTNNKGGPELHVRYIISQVKPIKKFKVCTIF
jgi:type IX secretion system PorP/SprF family membrane protein